jgi:hypothetical protein
MKLLATLVLLCLAWPVFALRPVPPPDFLIKEAEEVLVIHQGDCKLLHGELPCIAGVHQQTKELWLLLFDRKTGVLIQVLTVTPDGKESIRWNHPDVVT